MSLKYEKPTCQAYHEEKFENYNLEWKIIYSIPRIANELVYAKNIWNQIRP